MKINKIILSNIGAYHGHYELDLSVNNPKKILVLFGGKNGAGKTTLLESIRIALFGPFLYGLRTESDQYQKKIKSLLNNTAISEGESLFRISLEIDKVENYVRKTFTIKRSWHLEGKKIRESFEVIKDGQYLNEREKEIFQNKLREDSPPQLFELCLFDGEEIGRIISDNKLPSYLKTSARVLFNLDLFENLEQDLSQYIKQAESNGKKNELQNQLQQLDYKKEELQNELSNAETMYEKLINEITGYKQRLAKEKSDFEINGGLVKEQRDKLIQEISNIELQRKQNTEIIKSFINGLLPIYLNKELLIEVKNQMNDEQENESYTFIKDHLTSDKLTQLISKLVSMGLQIVDKESLNELLMSEFLSAIQPKGTQLIHRASFNQRSEIENYINLLEKLDQVKYIGLFHDNQRLLAESQQLRKKIEENDKNHGFAEILEQIQKFNQEIEKVQLKKIKQQEILDDLSIELTKINKEIESLKIKIMESTKSENTLSLSLKISEVSKKFRSLQLRKKLKDVEIEATFMANQLFRKEGFLNKIEINPETFELTLYGPNQEEIDQFNISAGEKELLLLSIFWAMFKTSGYRLPFIFDTLLGRLDNTHKKRLLTEFIPRCGEQVIILSTDSEIDNQHFELVKPIMSKAYTLDYDKEERRTMVHEGQYFNLYGMELSK